MAGAVFIGTLVSRPDIRQGFFAAAYVGLLALFGRELSGHESILYSIFILSAVLTQIAAVRWKSTLFSVLGHLPAILVLGLFLDGMQAGRSLWAGDPISLIDLMALAGVGFIGTLLRARELRLVYLYAAYAGLLIWTAREFYPMEQGQALMSLAFGGTVLLTALVGATSAVGVMLYYRKRNVRLRPALLFAASGVPGSWFGSSLTREVAPHTLMLIFAGLVLVVGVLMLGHKNRAQDRPRSCYPPRCLVAGALVGSLTGFLGVGGGFLLGIGNRFAGRPESSAVTVARSG